MQGRKGEGRRGKDPPALIFAHSIDLAVVPAVEFVVEFVVDLAVVPVVELVVEFVVELVELVLFGSGAGGGRKERGEAFQLQSVVLAW